MARKLFKQKYFVPKELRLSIALIILWSLLSTAFFTYAAKELGGKIGHGVPLFVIIMVGYLAIVIFLTMLFSHRMLGPFQRLKTEMRLILAGESNRRLNVRSSDDIYIKSFISEVNRVIDHLDTLHNYKEDVTRQIDSEMLNLIALLEEAEMSKEKLRELILELHKKLKSLDTT